jgi:uncharacterized protein (DUF433 family)
MSRETPYRFLLYLLITVERLRTQSRVLIPVRDLAYPVRTGFALRGLKTPIGDLRHHRIQVIHEHRAHGVAGVLHSLSLVWKERGGAQHPLVPFRCRRIIGHRDSREHSVMLKRYDERRVIDMANLDWSQCPVVESIPGKVSGAWLLRGTRTPVKVLFENLEAGMSIEEVVEQFRVTREQIDSLMAFVAKSLDKPPTYG